MRRQRYLTAIFLAGLIVLTAGCTTTSRQARDFRLMDFEGETYCVALMFAQAEGCEATDVPPQRWVTPDEGEDLDKDDLTGGDSNLSDAALQHIQANDTWYFSEKYWDQLDANQREQVEARVESWDADAWLDEYFEGGGFKPSTTRKPATTKAPPTTRAPARTQPPPVSTQPRTTTRLR